MATDNELGFSKPDFTRRQRTGMSETVFCPGKTVRQLELILQRFREADVRVLGTKCSQEQAEHLRRCALPVVYDPISRLLYSLWGEPAKQCGRIAVCTGGTADVPVAEEAIGTAMFLGAGVDRFFDIGVAGLHRILSNIEDIRRADVVIAVAGMEGALGSVLAGLIEAPLIAVPTSVGYGAGFGGIAPLLAMLNSCAEGMTVVNIDNGFGAAVSACRMVRKMKAETTHD